MFLNINFDIFSMYSINLYKEEINLTIYYIFIFTLKTVKKKKTINHEKY